MSEQREDGLVQIQESGRWLRYFGFYPIISVVILFVAVLFIMFYLISSLTSASTIDSQQFSNTFNLAIFMVFIVALLISLGEIFIIYKLYSNLQEACSYDLIEQATMEKTLLPLKLGILLKLLSSIIPLIILLVYYVTGTPILDVSSQSQINQSNLTFLQNTTYIRIIDILYNAAIFYGIFEFHKWTVLIANSYPSPMTDDAVTGMNYLRISLGLTALITLLNLVGLGIPFVSLVSFILLVYGGHKAGNALKYFASLRAGNYNKFQMNGGTSYQSGYAPSNFTSQSTTGTFGEDTTSTKTCPQCNNPVSENNKFCQQCGYSFVNFNATEKSMKCATCQSVLTPDTHFCSTCGSKVN